MQTPQYIPNASCLLLNGTCFTKQATHTVTRQLRLTLIMETLRLRTPSSAFCSKSSQQGFAVQCVFTHIGYPCHSLPIRRYYSELPLSYLKWSPCGEIDKKTSEMWGFKGVGMEREQNLVSVGGVGGIQWTAPHPPHFSHGSLGWSVLAEPHYDLWGP